MTYLLDVLIPTFNGAQHIFQTVSTIAEQILISKEKVSISIFDNASTDDTLEQVRPLIDKYNFIRYVSQSENYGPDFNYKSAADNARGEFFWFFSDDDLVTDGGIIKVCSLLHKIENTVGLIFLNCRIKNILKGEVQLENVAGVERSVKFDKGSDIFCTPAINLMGIASTIIIRKEAASKSILADLIGSNHMHVGYACYVASRCDFFIEKDIIFEFRRDAPPRWLGQAGTQRFHFGYVEGALWFEKENKFIKRESERRIISSIRRLATYFLRGHTLSDTGFDNQNVTDIIERAKVSKAHVMLYRIIQVSAKIILKR